MRVVVKESVLNRIVVKETVVKERGVKGRSVKEISEGDGCMIGIVVKEGCEGKECKEISVKGCVGYGCVKGRGVWVCEGEGYCV